MNTAIRPNVQPHTARRLLATLCMSLVLACGIVSAANAEDVLLNSSNVRATTTEDLNLIRTSMTPSKVELQVPVAMGNTVCVQYGTRMVTGRSGARCGYDHVVRRVCVPQRVCHVNRRTGKTECTTVQHCANRVIEIERTCSWEETYCMRTEVQTSNKTRTVTLKFKNMSSLASGEQETFKLVAEQTHTDGQDARFSLTPVSTRHAVKITARDGLFSGFKDVLVIKGE